ncbi:MAG: hypothetical protein EOO65_00680 [Methanosarcinales archaeon]|nr:MAG: hypothetical protein EOO65_00680 [Methanosarcinales archaeon]
MLCLQADMKETQDAWNKLREYMTERDAMAQVDWFAFRPRVNELQDFANKWQSQVADGVLVCGALSTRVVSCQTARRHWLTDVPACACVAAWTFACRARHSSTSTLRQNSFVRRRCR